jgi:hypothetical protein
MHERNKWAFWTLVCAALVIVCVPSTILLGAFERYERFLTGFEPGTIRPVKTRSMPHDSDRSKAPPEPKFEFVDFQLRDPSAKKVCLVGDFNHWKPETLFLAKLPDGSWELTLPLPSGRYRYRFWVDGAERVDPAGKTPPEPDPVGGQPASIREVK